jgi:glycosyltransferase involved in cell wall biosynthesis
MRILLIGPRHAGGSIPPYLDILADGLRHYGACVNRLGSAGVPYDPATVAFWPADRIFERATRLLNGTDISAYDVISLHFGNLEIEQLLPVIWTGRPRAPVVCHVHTLQPTLFRAHVPDSALRDAVDEAAAAMDGYVFFGEHARRQITGSTGTAVPAAVAWLPATIPAGTQPVATPRLAGALATAGQTPVGSLCGYAAPWKDPATLLAACQQISAPARIVLAGPFWDDPVQAGIGLAGESTTLVRHDQAEVTVVAEYLGHNARRALTAASNFAVFPYRPHPAFQGSGAIADYLVHGVPVLATDVANMAELAGDAGLITAPGDPAAFARGLDRLAADRALRAQMRKAARQRAHLFTARQHACVCLRLYEQVTETRNQHL